MVTNTNLGDLVFKYFPSCLTPIEDKEDDEHCGLCKTELSKSQRHYAYMQMVNEINFQISESESLVKSYHKEVDGINLMLTVINNKIDSLKVEYQEIVENADFVDARLSDIGGRNLICEKSNL